MNLRSITWRNREAINITSGDCELIVGVSVGPRILSLRHGTGDNLLYEDNTGFCVGEWRLYGGHRFTIAPEDENSYYPDNEVCTVDTNSETIIISAPVRPNGIRLSVNVTPAKTDNGFEIVHTLENRGSVAWTGALWAITCVPRSAYIEAACATSDICYWPGTDPSNWPVRDRLMRVEAGDFRGKVGWHEGKGWLSARQGDTHLTIRNQDETIAANCVDNGCNLEIFACKDWLELETLGNQVVVPPGGFAQHVQHWLIGQH